MNGIGEVARENPRPMGTAPQPPRAPRRPTVLRQGERERTDDYYWMRERTDPDVIAYLEAENAHVTASLADLQPLRESIFGEIKSRIRETDASAPVRWGKFEYFTRTIADKEYAVHCRRPCGTQGLPDPEAAPGTPEGEEVLLDQNAAAAGASYFALRGFQLSPDHSTLAYSTDLTGGERGSLYFRDLASGKDLGEQVDDVYYGLAWANDDRTLLYVRADASMRPWQVWRHVLGTSASDDVLVFQEDDERFEVYVQRTRTGAYLVITSTSKLTSEVRLVSAAEPTSEPWLFAARRQGIEYHVEHYATADGSERFYVLTNEGDSPNFKLLVTSRADVAAPERWTFLLAHRDDVRLVDVEAFAEHIVVVERAEGLERLRVIGASDGSDRYLE